MKVYIFNIPEQRSTVEKGFINLNKDHLFFDDLSASWKIPVGYLSNGAVWDRKNI